MTVKLEIKIDDIDRNAMTLHFKASSQGNFVIRQYVITTDFGRHQQRTPDRIEEGSAEAVGRLHHTPKT
jgi:hypothetical protein